MKKKGFTLIELLAVIVILAIILLIATPIILNVIKDAKAGALEITRKNMEKAAELYVFRNANDFSLKKGEKKYIQLEQLEDGYIKPVKSPDGKKCEGYVKVESINNTIEYTAFLDCGNGNNLLVDSSYVNYGGNYLDEFTEVIKTSDGGYLAVGSSNSSKIGNNTRHGSELNYDAIIVKYNKDGVEEWSKNFGGTNHDNFYGVVEDDNGYVVVGSSSSNDGDMSGLNPNIYNSILVKYDYNGNVIKKMIVTSSSSPGSEAKKIIYKNGNYYVTGDGRTVLALGAWLQYIIKYDNDFNEIWKKTYGGTYGSRSYSIKMTDDNNLVIAGMSQSTDNEMGNIKIGATGIPDATIFVIDKDSGEIIEKGIFGGTAGGDYFTNVIEVSDGYIAVGHSNSTDHNMLGLSKGDNDAVVVKYSKTSTNGVLSIEWIKVIGGSDSDIFNGVILKDSELILLGYSNSIDGDLSNITKENNGYYDGIIIKMDLNGNILNKTTYGGSKSDFLNNGIYNEQKYVIVGRSFSTDNNIEPFNLGNSDAIMITLDNELKEIRNFKLQTLLMNKPKELIKNYGTSIPLPENKEILKLYTTNDATIDLGKWCTANIYIDPNSNYNNVNCLYPFDLADTKTLYSDVIKFQNEINITPMTNNNWIRIYFNFGNAGGGLEINNLKIKFLESEYITIEEAVNLGYIEPLVIVGNIRNTPNEIHPPFTNGFNIIKGESSGFGSYPSFNILIKPKNKKMEKISFDSAKELLMTQANFQVHEFSNFDISLTAAE